MADQRTPSDVLERFLRYVQVDTPSSDAHADQTPSTPEQFDLAHVLADELRELGAEDVEVSEHAYVTARVPASPGAEHLPALGLIAHIDTTEAAPGRGVKPHVVRYTGGDLICGEHAGTLVAIGPDKLPVLDGLVGEDLVCSDGTTLLGADDKAGVAEIMGLVARLAAHPELPHPRLGICFCPDEEIGHGAALLDLEAFGCAFAYTVDGGPIGELEWECFNACEVTVTFQGYSIHAGDAKNRMVNAANLFCAFHAMLPAAMRPEHTEGYEGFIHLLGVSATCERVRPLHRARPRRGALRGENRPHGARRGLPEHRARHGARARGGAPRVPQHGRGRLHPPRAHRAREGSLRRRRRRAARAAHPRRH